MRFVCLAFLFLLIAGTANAAEPDAPNARAPSASDNKIWSGPYVGIAVGAVQNNGYYTNGLNDWYNFTSSTPLTTSRIGVLGSLEAGYNYQIDSIMFGAEGDWGLTNTHGNTGFPEYGDYTNGVHATTTLLNLATLRARLGYAADKLLLFGTGGLAIGRVNTAAYDYISDVYHDSSYRAGWTSGGGLEYALTQDWSIKAEGLYYDLGSIKNQHFIYSATPYGSYDNYVNGVVARFGVNYMF